MTFKIQKSDSEWKELLAEKGAERGAFDVTRHASTERPFTGKYEAVWDDGSYHCICCGAKLFDSGTKFDAHCGWPSFSQAVPGAVKEITDSSHGMARTETVCAQCGAHLGHVFPDGPTDTGLRYCMNSASLEFEARMKLFFDFLPGLFFLGALFLFDIYTATAVVMAAMGVQIVAMLALKKKISGVQWFTFGIVLIFGSATLLLHDANFIKWKPTVINWMFAVMLFLGPVILKKNFIRILMSEHMTLPDRVWAKLNLGWATLLALLGALNLVIAYNFSERIWGLYKVFGMTGLMVLFVVAQTLWISRYLPEEGKSQS